MSDAEFQYLVDRVDDQLKYFDSRAMSNQRAYRRLKLVAITCNILTTMTIALAFTAPDRLKVPMSILALVLSTIVLATYQLEEFQSFGAKWEKFRLVAEQIKSEKFMFLNRAGRYSAVDLERGRELFVESVEGLIRGTDIAYFTLMVDPGKRIEKRLQDSKESD